MSEYKSSIYTEIFYRIGENCHSHLAKLLLFKYSFDPFETEADWPRMRSPIAINNIEQWTHWVVLKQWGSYNEMAELFMFRCSQLRPQPHYLRSLVQTLQTLSQVSHHSVLGPALSQEMINFLLLDQSLLSPIKYSSLRDIRLKIF